MKKNIFVVILALSTIVFFDSCRKSTEINQVEEDLIVKNPEATSIYNGNSYVSINSRPYQAAVFIDNEFTGGGVILNENWILTAGHVVTIGGGYSGDVYTSSRIQVGTGSSKLSTINLSSVQQVIRYPSYSFDYDIALIKLSTPLQLGVETSSITYANDTYLQYIIDDRPAIVSGWGLLENGLFPDNLFYTDVLLTNNASSLSTIYTKSASSQLQQAPCFGDSGGPLTIKVGNNIPVLAGIVNGWGDCSTGIKGYARITYFASWIQQETGIQSADPIPQLSISGPDYMCVWGGGFESPYIFGIPNLPVGASVLWDVSPSSSVVIDGPNNQSQVSVLLVDNIKRLTLTATVSINGISIPIVKEINSGYPEDLNFHTDGSGSSASSPLYISLLSGSGCLGPDYVNDVEWEYYTDNGVSVNVVSDNNPYTCGVVPKDGIVLYVDKPYGVSTTLTVRVRAKNQCGWSGFVTFTRTYSAY